MASSVNKNFRLSKSFIFLDATEHLNSPYNPGASLRVVPHDTLILIQIFADVEEGGRKATVQAPTGMFACFQIGFYQPYFNVDTSDVKDRLAATMFFFKAEPTFLALIGDTPDFYGPFWVKPLPYFGWCYKPSI